MRDNYRHQHTYIRRRGRITQAQQRGLDLAESRYALRDLDVAALGSCAGLGVEIGFGMGQALLHWAQSAPDWHLIGIELYQPGVGSLAHMLDSHGLHNVHIVQQPAQEVFTSLEPEVLDEVRIYFPDPWPKKRHFKRRLIQEPFLQQLHRTLRGGGLVKLATDWSEYAQWMREHFESVPGFSNVVDEVAHEDASPEYPDRPVTKFERRGEGLGHRIHDLVYRADK